MSHFSRCITICRICFLFLALSLISCGKRQNAQEMAVVWVNSTATTPVLPLYALEGKPLALEFREWNTTMSFQSLLLGGKGTLWVGHLEGFARAYAHGARLRLLAVTGWRKWEILSKRGNARFPEDFSGAEIFAGPADGAGRYLLEALLKEEGVALSLKPMDMKPLLLRALDGKADTLLVPEPFATMLVKKELGFHRVCRLEEYYGRCRNCEPEVPWAGIAVNADWADAHPETVSLLLEAILEAGRTLSSMSPEAVAEFWPEKKNLSTGITRQSLRESLQRDPVKVVSAEDGQAVIRRFLQTVAPDVPFDPEMLWHSPK